MKNTYYVLHVKEGFKEREKSILEQFLRLDLPFEWILNHDKNDITSELLTKYKYSGSLNKEAISCALKHICAWEQIARGDTDGAFVFEDDALIDIKRFKSMTQEALAEFHAQGLDCGYISLGSGCALYVPWTKKKTKIRLYRAEHVRATDSYWINRQTAIKKVQWIKENGFSLPADHLVDKISSELEIPIFWMEPTVVNQGSHTGLFSSSIQDLERGTFIDKLGWRIKVIRRKYLYPLIGVDLRKND